MSRDGHIELDWAVAAIRVGSRARRDLGDLSGLVESIRTGGLLQPITVSPDGVLLCGARRLAAVQQLGWRTVSVWVRTGLSTRLERLVAEQDENTVRQPLLPTEAASLYQELRQVLAEDAARRQDAAQWSDRKDRASGGAKLASAGGPSRQRAARMVTGANSYTTLERVGRVQQIAEDPTVEAGVRRVAADALTRMDAVGKVDGQYRLVQAAVEAARERQLSALAVEAIARASAESDPAVAGDGATTGPRTTPAGGGPQVARRLGVRAFLLTWNELLGWSTRYDPVAIAGELTAGQWESFAGTVQETVEFLDRVREARMADR